jgi:BirA family biotin operon repressor/biotin-[acetyl-CoA-carboxylase] ligase
MDPSTVVLVGQVTAAAPTVSNIGVARPTYPVGMDLPLSRAVAPHLEFVPESESTNAELAARASGAGDFTVLATTSQTAGKGRLGRTWVAPPGRTIAVSVLLRPSGLTGDDLGWLPLLAGLAMRRGVASLVDGHPVTLKWPNDVQLDGLKVSGVLAELVPPGDTVVVGAGLNLTMTEAELPTPVSTSLTLNGVPADGLVDRALAAYLGELRRLYDPFDLPALRAAVAAECSTIGHAVRVDLPSGDDLFGTAVGIDEHGRLIVRAQPDARLVPIAAGDVTHLRHE